MKINRSNSCPGYGMERRKANAASMCRYRHVGRLHLALLQCGMSNPSTSTPAGDYSSERGKLAAVARWHKYSLSGPKAYILFMALRLW